ncbi:head-tail connector protein [Sphingobium phenoxybenzoativorans]|uniref:Head-tail connector protein n=1 Tax=Sphingobium phenoxybenzoativorans TaxID=1592790 RepID=A0A975KAQ5_9SPHN|nr:head-tail connector protein [Sphingobium phenoxybenzoativorans]QUT07926.1 head-tail connector protein [Sphingobium phenoxybenzoativorans]
MAEPIDLDQAKAQLRVDHGDEDDLITGLIQAAREWVENYTGLILVQRNVTETFDSLCKAQRLDAWPIEADASVSIAYLDGGGIQQELTDVRLLAGKRPARISAAIGAAWPTIYSADDAVAVTVQAGYPTAEAVPWALKQAILLHIQAMYDQGSLGSAEEAALKSLCWPFVRITV